MQRLSKHLLFHSNLLIAFSIVTIAYVMIFWVPLNIKKIKYFMTTVPVVPHLYSMD